MYTKEYLLSTGYFIDNNYFNLYYNLICNSRVQKEKFKTNTHHILPRHYFKKRNLELDNSQDNVVVLLFKDHMLAHLYMSGCTTGQDKYWNIYAISQMSGHIVNDCDKNSFAEITSLNYYQSLYEDAIKAAPNHRKGTKVSEETREKMRRAQAGHISPAKGKIWINNGTIDKLIYESDLHQYEILGYTKGRTFRHSDEFKKEQALRSHNRVITDEFREKMRVIAIEEMKHRDPEIYKRHSEKMKGRYAGEKNPFFGKKHSKESIDKNRQAHLNKKAVSKEGTIKMVDEKDISQYLSDGWVLGRKG